MTDRDEFAKAALTGLIARGCDMVELRNGRRAYLIEAYEIADAMLTAREHNKDVMNPSAKENTSVMPPRPIQVGDRVQVEGRVSYISRCGDYASVATENGKLWLSTADLERLERVK